MPRKILAIGIVLVIISGLALSYFVTDGFTFYPIQIKINQLSINEDHSTYTGQVHQYIGNHEYIFEYIPTSFDFNQDKTYNGTLSIQRTDLQKATTFPLRIGASQNYYGITFTITQAKSDYAIVLVKPT